MRHVLTVCLGIAAACAWAEPPEALRQRGVVALMRHALAPGTGDPAGFDLGSCASQRNLDEQGRAQARRTGVALRAAGVRFDAVWTSQWCRARETAMLMELGLVQEQPPLNSFFEDRGEASAQTAATLRLIAEMPADARLLIVTHQVNITALTGLGVGSGEIIVTRRTPAGLKPVARYAIAP